MEEERLTRSLIRIELFKQEIYRICANFASKSSAIFFCTFSLICCACCLFMVDSFLRCCFASAPTTLEANSASLFSNRRIMAYASGCCLAIRFSVIFSGMAKLSLKTPTVNRPIPRTSQPGARTVPSYSFDLNSRKEDGRYIFD